LSYYKRYTLARNPLLAPFRGHRPALYISQGPCLRTPPRCCLVRWGTVPVDPGGVWPFLPLTYPHSSTTIIYPPPSSSHTQPAQQPAAPVPIPLPAPHRTGPHLPLCARLTPPPPGPQEVVAACAQDDNPLGTGGGSGARGVPVGHPRAPGLSQHTSLGRG